MQDSDPARRNLSVTSLAFIVYALAGGSFESNQVRLQVINVEFSDPLALAFIAWGMLFWFAFRYWHSREHSLSYVCNVSISGFQTGLTFKLIKYLISKSKIEHGFTEIRSIYLDNSSVKELRFSFSQHNGSVSGGPVYSPKNKLIRFILKSILYSGASIKQHNILDHTFPYILFFLAITLNGYFSALIDKISSLLPFI